MRWKDKLLKELIFQLKNDKKGWELILSQVLSDKGVGVHMAIFNEPFLTAILEKQKTMESRFSVNRVTPFRRVYSGDIVLIKKTAGSVIGFFISGEVKYWVRNKSSLYQIENDYGNAICSNLDPDFWKKRENSKYGTLIEIDELHLLNSFRINKQDRTAWTVLREKHKLSIFDQQREFNE